MEAIILAITPYKEIIFGALIASIGFIYKSSKQKKQKLRQAYYFLFEIWHYLSAIDKFQPEKLSRNLIEEIISEFKLEISKKESQQANEMICLILINHIKPMLLILSEKSISKLAKPFEKSVQEIALDYPLIAYRINTTIELEDLTNSLKSLVKSVQGISTDEMYKVSDVLQSKIYSDSATALLSNLKCLSFKISIATYLKSLYYIYKRNKRLELNKDSIKNEVLPVIKSTLSKK